MSQPNLLPPGRDDASPPVKPRDLVLGAIAFVVFLWVGRGVGGWLDAPPAPPATVEAAASPAPRRSPTPIPSPTPTNERIALLMPASVDGGVS
jgi:hypothetical protein